MTSSSPTPSSAPRTVDADLLSILRDELNVDPSRVTPDARLVDDVGLDSVAFAVGMVAIEERLGVSLSEEELLNCDTVGDLQAAIAAKSRDE
ncbi:acyl carrier protein [Mycobacterium colombiense]|uniref:acyl carrier protein n=1 Tax=Mycobacterium colombiense TaxID=339268 RepID=UPI00097D181B|nr:acyl carrier protein [Mycobacterium colombiense]MCK8643962.1 acyl carrier protein [Mycobacterium colombiense]